MKIYLHEFKEVETELDFTESESWVADAVAKVDESSETLLDAKSPPRAGAPSAPVRPARVHFSLRKVDEVFLVSGQIQTSVQLLCSRCARLYTLKMSPSFSALFCKDPVMAGVAFLQPEGRNPRGPMKPMGQNQGHARHAHDWSEDGAGSSESGKDLDITYISHDFIDLADVLTEQLLFQVPFQPLCKEDCKGMCSQCGADLNTGRCACAKLTRTSPFSVLRDLKIDKRANEKVNEPAKEKSPKVGPTGLK